METDIVCSPSGSSSERLKGGVCIEIFSCHIYAPSLGKTGFPEPLARRPIKPGCSFSPLQSALEHGSYALLDNVVLMAINHCEHAHALSMDLGVSYTSSIPGCACESDPTPESELSEYTVLRLFIDRETASFSLQVLPQ